MTSFTEETGDHLFQSVSATPKIH